MRILIIEDNKQLAGQIRDVLLKGSYKVQVINDGINGLKQASEEVHDLIILDLMLPGMDGMAILRKMRREDINIPVLILSAKGQTEDKVEALDLGADDYLTKPFAASELLARVRSLLRRKNDLHTNELKIGELTIKPKSREVYRGKKIILLTSKEYELLEFLAYNKGSVVSRNALGEHVWGETYDPFLLSNFIDVHVKNLRKKINSTHRRSYYITTKRGVGFMLSVPVKK